MASYEVVCPNWGSTFDAPESPLKAESRRPGPVVTRAPRPSWTGRKMG